MKKKKNGRKNEGVCGSGCSKGAKTQKKKWERKNLGGVPRRSVWELREEGEKMKKIKKIKKMKSWGWGVATAAVLEEAP